MPFKNFHGITRDNLESFLVEPFSIRVDPDDLESDPRDMWVVLQQGPHPESGYVVIYDPLNQGWGVAEHQDSREYTLVVGAESLAGALDSM